MANTLFDKGRERFAKGLLNWTGSTPIKAVLVNTALYTPIFTTDEFYSAVTARAGAVVAGPVLLANPTAAGGACAASNITFSSVSGATIQAIVIYQDTGTDAASPLIAYIDTATGLPITPNGGDIIVSWDAGPNKIFKL